MFRVAVMRIPPLARAEVVAAGQLVTWPTRHTVKSSHCISQTVTQSQATRHKLTHMSKLTWHFPR